MSNIGKQLMNETMVAYKLTISGLFVPMR